MLSIKQDAYVNVRIGARLGYAKRKIGARACFVRIKKNKLSACEVAMAYRHAHGTWGENITV